MGAVLPLQHTHALELLGNWLLLFSVQNAECQHFPYQREKNSEKCSFLVSLLLRGGIWILGNGTQQAVSDARSGVRALVQTHVVNSAMPDISPCNASLALLPLLSLSPPSAPCVSCTLGVVLWTNMFPCHSGLNEHPKTFVCGVIAPVTSVEIWHGSFCPTLLPQNKHKHLSTCRSQDGDTGALNLLLGFTVLFLFSNALAAILLKTINPEMFSFTAKNN